MPRHQIIHAARKQATLFLPFPQLMAALRALPVLWEFFITFPRAEMNDVATCRFLVFLSFTAFPFHFDSVSISHFFALSLAGLWAFGTKSRQDTPTAWHARLPVVLCARCPLLALMRLKRHSSNGFFTLGAL